MSAGSPLDRSSSKDREIAQGTNEHIVGRAADEIPAWRDRIRQPAGPMGDVEDRMGGKGKSKNGQRVSRVAHESRGGEDEKPDRERDVEANALLRLVRDGKTDVGAGGQREQQRRELPEPKLRDETVGRGRGDLRRADGVPREPDRQPARRHRDGPQRLSHEEKYSWRSRDDITRAPRR